MLIDQILGVVVLFGIFFVDGVSYRNAPHGDKFHKLLFPHFIYCNYGAHTCNAVINYKLKFKSHFRYFIFITAAKYRNNGMGAKKIFVVCILLISAFHFQKHTPCLEILLVSHAFFHLNITTSGIMSVPEMERNLSGVPQQLTMNKMKNGDFAQMLVRCCLSSLSPLQEFVLY